MTGTAYVTRQARLLIASLSMILGTAVLTQAAAETLIIQGSTTFSRRLLETNKAAIETESKHELTVIPNKSMPGLIALLGGNGEIERPGVGPLFEGAPSLLARLAAARPYEDWPALFRRARAIAHGMPEAEQVELLDAHPRLGAPPVAISVHSFREQGYGRDAFGAAGPAAADEDRRVAAELERLNAAYEARFGFRYCVFVAGRPLAGLLPGMAEALSAERDAELHRAVDAVVDIAVARLEALRASGA